MGYATLAQFYATGLPANALTGIAVTALQSALDNAAAEMDSRAFNARFVLPLIPPYPLDLVQINCDLAAWIALKARGYDPSSKTDIAVRQGWVDALAWLDGVAGERIQPTVIDSSSGGNSIQAPQVLSSPLRGWEPAPLGVWPGGSGDGGV